MYNRLQYYSVYLRVFFVALCEIAIAQPVPPCGRVTQRSPKLHKDQTRLMITLIIIGFQYTDCLRNN